MERITLLLIIALAIAGNITTQQEASPNLKRLSLVAAAEKSSYIVGEPVDLTFSLSNVSDKTVEGNFCFGVDHYNPEVWYGKETQKPLLYVGNFPVAEDITCLPRELSPHASKSSSARLLYAVNPGWLILREPGVYEFQLKYKLSDGDGTKIVSNVVQIKVEAAPESEKEALRQWSDPELLDFVQGNAGFAPGAKVRDGFKKASTFYDAHGDSLYAKAARKGLLDYLTSRSRAQRLTTEEKVVFDRLSGEP
jgi:hypothetical protein